MKRLQVWLRQLLCAHTPTYDRLVETPEGLLVRTRCLRCGAFQTSAQPVRRRDAR
jgi:hypothetical protein